MARIGHAVSSEMGFRDFEEVSRSATGKTGGACSAWQAGAVMPRLDVPPPSTVAPLGGEDYRWWESDGCNIGHASHRVWVIGEYAACLRCGAYITNDAVRAYRLHEPCPGHPPNPSAALRLRRLRQGKHPFTDRWIAAPRLSRVEQNARGGARRFSTSAFSPRPPSTVEVDAVVAPLSDAAAACRGSSPSTSSSPGAKRPRLRPAAGPLFVGAPGRGRKRPADHGAPEPVGDLPRRRLRLSGLHHPGRQQLRLRPRSQGASSGLEDRPLVRRRITFKRPDSASRVFVRDIAGRFGRSFATQSGDFCSGRGGDLANTAGLAGSGAVAESGQVRGQVVAPLTAVGSSHAPSLASAEMVDGKVQGQEARHHLAANLLESLPCYAPPALINTGWSPATH